MRCPFYRSENETVNKAKKGSALFGYIAQSCGVHSLTNKMTDGSVNAPVRVGSAPPNESEQKTASERGCRTTPRHVSAQDAHP